MLNFKITIDEIMEIKRILNPFRGWMRKFEYNKKGIQNINKT